MNMRSSSDLAGTASGRPGTVPRPEVVRRESHPQAVEWSSVEVVVYQKALPAIAAYALAAQLMIWLYAKLARYRPIAT